MDIVCGVVAGALIGIPWAYSQLHQSTATPRGWHWISAPSRDPLTGQAREVGTPDLPTRGVPTSSTPRTDMP